MQQTPEIEEEVPEPEEPEPLKPMIIVEEVKEELPPPKVVEIKKKPSVKKLKVYDYSAAQK